MHQPNLALLENVKILAMPIEDNATTDLIKAVDELLDQLRTKFMTSSEEMLAKSMISLNHQIVQEIMCVVDDMSRRLDNLEASLRADDRKEIERK